MSKHSRKPPEFYSALKDLYYVNDMNWLEIFARDRNKDNHFMDLYGNEIEGNF